VSVRYEPKADSLVLVLANTGPTACVMTVRPNAYLSAPPRAHHMAAGAMVEDRWAIGASAHWYDFSVTSDCDAKFERRLAGHMETGAPSRSDPLIGTVQA
jgi:phospholipase C